MLTFYGIGAQKCGTSWLHELLNSHPEVGFPLGKEVHFWNHRYAEGLDWYRGHFTDPLRKEGDITPAYAILPLEKIQEIHQHFPELRLIYMVRDPRARAWSAAQMALMKSDLTPEDVSVSWYLDHIHSRGSRARSDYAGCLQRWESVVAPEKILLLRYEDIAARPRDVLAAVCRHLGISFPWSEGETLAARRFFEGHGIPAPEPVRVALEALYADAWQAFLATYAPRLALADAD